MPHVLIAIAVYVLVAVAKDRQILDAYTLKHSADCLIPLRENTPRSIACQHRIGIEDTVKDSNRLNLFT